MHRSRILIVDDDPLVRDVLASIFLQAQQYETVMAADGIEGMARVQDGDFDMVFTDITMPGINGIDFVREAAKVRPSLPVVVITGNSTLENAVNAMREGARDFITKPFSVATVTSLAERIIGEQRLLDSIGKDGSHDPSVVRLNAELFRKLQEIGLLQSLSSELDDLSTNKEIFERIVEMASRLLTVREASFGIVENGVLVVRKSLGVTDRKVSVADGLFGRVVRTGRHCTASPGEIDPLTGRQLAAPLLAVPLTVRGEVFGILSMADKADGTAFTDDEVSLAVTFAKKAAQRIENNALYEVFYNNLINTLMSLVNSIEARDSYTKHHSERVTSYALDIADVMGLNAEGREALRFGGYLHDIGKIGVRDTILLKPGRLTEEERAEINLHPVIGGNIIKPLQFFPNERELILHHHEHFDGRGYPDRLSGRDIPLTARVLAVADAYDAMTTSRPYREARSHAEAASELARCSGVQFDGDVVRAFLQSQG